MRRLLPGLLVALLAALSLSCGDTGDEIRVGFVPKSLNQEYWVNTQKGAEAGAKRPPLGALAVTCPRQRICDLRTN